MGDQKTPKKRGPKPQATTTFLTHREIIAAELKEGWRMTVIYRRYATQLDISYVQFTRYVHRFIQNKQEKQLHVSARSTAETVSKHVSSPEQRDGPILTQARQTKRFVFDPTAAHRRKDKLF